MLAAAASTVPGLAFVGCATGRSGGDALPFDVLVQRLTEAVRVRDLDEAAALGAPASPGLQSIGWLVANAVQFADVSFAPALTPAVGRDHAVTVSWTLREESERRSSELWVQLAADGRIAATNSRRSGPLPLWLVEPVSVTTTSAVTLVTASTRSSGLSVREVEEAAATVSSARLGPLADGWNGRLLVEQPSTVGALEECLHVEPGSYAGVPAATTAQGTAEGGSTPTGVLVDADVMARLPRHDRMAVLVHEAVHAATSSPVSKAPLWAVEGLAEVVAANADPQRATRLRATARTLPANDALVEAADFEPSSGRAALAYARSWAVVAAVIARSGWRGAMADLAAWADGRPTRSPSEITRWYHAWLSRLRQGAP